MLMKIYTDTCNPSEPNDTDGLLAGMYDANF